MIVKNGLQSLQRCCKFHSSRICSDSVYGRVDFGMNDIVIESNYSVYFTGKWYLQVFDTTVFLVETLDVLRDINNIKLKYIRTNLHYFVVQEVNPLAPPVKILLLVAIALDFWWNSLRGIHELLHTHLHPL